MNKTSIEWVRNPDGSQGYTHNSMTGCRNCTDEGLCKGGGFPCYAYKLAHGRLKPLYLANHKWTTCEVPHNIPALLDPFFPRFWSKRLWDTYTKKPKGIFVCDMGELFGYWIPDQWQKAIFENFRCNPQHRFYLLTKQPQNLIKFSPFPENCWVGVTATNSSSFHFAEQWLKQVQATIRFISIEPLLGQIDSNIGWFEGKYLQTILKEGWLQWLIIGACTGTLEDIKKLLMLYPQLTPMPYGKKWTAQPKIEWVEEIVQACDKAGVKVFLKDNLTVGPTPILNACLFSRVIENGSYKLRQEIPNDKRSYLLNKVTEELAGSNERTTKQFTKISSQFYTSSGGDFTRRAVVNYITKMAEKCYGPGTIRLHFRVLKRAFEIASKIEPGIEWPFSKRPPAEIENVMTSIPWQESENKIAFSADDIKQMIDAAKQGFPNMCAEREDNLKGISTALVALSTTYGLRRIEMADLDSDALNLKTKRLRVLTKHGSRLREHVIPDEIIPYLKDYQALRSEFKLSEIFHDIEKASGLSERYGTGWHCIRRGLVNNLVKVKLEVPEKQGLLYIYSFMRWKLSMTFGMLGTYFTEDPRVVDEAILKAHPFLKFWNNE